ncbi:DUF222 domain-containing protein [Nocardia sp. SYP-A9097]|uniref:DUF222 domain-containing protein n=1 Tax=Nocardia sp. SYP-A9097 TaxID=2663237 RepID=UPI00129A804A|nr:DUF222 domain-containing protein [Nocardia sp. SYP-A9097]MRH88115.1 DUF222 domain-containing protein [Nocardia sp. SYP-A9097]
MFDSGEAEAMGDAELIDALRRAHGAAAFAQAAEITAIREVYRRHRAGNAEPGPGGVRAGEFAAAEVAVAVHTSETVAAALIDIGLALDSLPQTRKAFAAGRIDLSRVQVIAEAMRGLSREIREALEPKLIDAATRTDPGRLRQTARRWIIRLDTDGEQRRREERETDRDVRIRAVADGMAVFDGLLPAAGAQTLAMRLREMSLQVCEDDPRTMPQRRADALVALADGTGRLRCGCTRGKYCPQAGAPAAPRRPLIQVGMSAETLLGLRDDPAFLSGYGPVDAALARTLAEHARFQVIPEYFAPAEEPAPTDPATPTRSAAEERSRAAHPAGSKRDPAPKPIAPQPFPEEPDRPAPPTARRGPIAPRAPWERVPGVPGGQAHPSEPEPLHIVGQQPSPAEPEVLRPAVSKADQAMPAESETIAQQKDSTVPAALRAAAHLAEATTPDALRAAARRAEATTPEVSRMQARRAAGTGAPGAHPAGSKLSPASAKPDVPHLFSSAPPREIRAFDALCRFPGCTMPAAETLVAQFDPLRSRRAPQNSAAPRAVLCSRHHRLKTLADSGKQPWRVYLADTDRMRWIDPTGESHETIREGARYLFPDTDIDAPTRATPHLLRAPEEPLNPPLPPRPFTADIAYPVDTHVLLHPQLARTTPENDIPTIPSRPAPR